MFGILQSRNEERYEPRDMLAIFKEDGTAELAPVVTINDERLLAGPYVGDGQQYAIPLEHVKSFTGPNGRIFLYPTTVENVTDCQRIAALERSTVLRQITHFQDTVIDTRKPVSKLVIFGVAAAILLLIIMVAK